MKPTRILILAAAALALTGCGDSATRSVGNVVTASASPADRVSAKNHTGPVPALEDPIERDIEDGAIQLQLQLIAEGNGLTAPAWGTSAPGQSGVLYVADQDGPLWAVDTASGAKAMCLNTRDLLIPIGAFGPGTYDERGFLGLAFHPDPGPAPRPGVTLAPNQRLLYTYTSESCDACNPFGQPNHRSVVREWVVTLPERGALRRGPIAEDPATGVCLEPGLSLAQQSRVVYSFIQPQFNHNGGAIFFGRTDVDRGLMYIASGDGGCADDQNGQQGLQGEGACISHEGEGNAQRTDTPLGKILRIDPLAHSGQFDPGDIFALGLRNPYRASADRLTGEIWTGDVGQNDVEEVDGPIPPNLPGLNFGWRLKEGSFVFHPNGTQLLGFASDGFVSAPMPIAGLVDPVAEYDHDEGVAIVGGFVYRGSQIESLYGRYVFGDYSHRPNSGNGRVMYIDPITFDQAQAGETRTIFNVINGKMNRFLHGFGEDDQGEIYVLASKDGIPFEEEGLIFKLVQRCPADADCRD